jgi:hypothetical protein
LTFLYASCELNFLFWNLSITGVLRFRFFKILIEVFVVLFLSLMFFILKLNSYRFIFLSWHMKLAYQIFRFFNFLLEFVFFFLSWSTEISFCSYWIWNELLWIFSFFIFMQLFSCSFFSWSCENWDSFSLILSINSMFSFSIVLISVDQIDSSFKEIENWLF